MSSIQEMGVQFIQYLQTFHPQLDGIMAFFAFFAKAEYFYVFIIPFLYWNFGNRFFIKLFIMLLIDACLGEVLRIGFAQPRPWWIAEMIPIDPVSSVYSSPGGYASYTTIFFGFIAYHFRKRIITFICVFMIFACSISKMYQAAMLPDHMVFGFMQGLLMLWIFVRKGDAIANWIISLSKKRVISLAFALGMLIYLTTYLITLLQLTYELPVYMLKYKVIPSVRLANGATPFMTGFLISALVSLNLNYYNHQESKINLKLWKRIVGTIMGLLVVFVLFILMRTTLIKMFNNDLVIGSINLSAATITGLWVYYYLPKRLYK